MCVHSGACVCVCVLCPFLVPIGVNQQTATLKSPAITRMGNLHLIVSKSPRIRNDLLRIEWDAKLYSLSNSHRSLIANHYYNPERNKAVIKLIILIVTKEMGLISNFLQLLL